VSNQNPIDPFLARVQYEQFRGEAVADEHKFLNEREELNSLLAKYRAEPIQEDHSVVAIGLDINEFRGLRVRVFTSKDPATACRELRSDNTVIPDSCSYLDFTLPEHEAFDFITQCLKRLSIVMIRTTPQSPPTSR
jgi:hypothetical protein